MKLRNQFGTTLLTLALVVLPGGCATNGGGSGSVANLSDLTRDQRSNCLSLPSRAAEIHVAVEKAVASLGLEKAGGGEYAVGRIELLLDQASASMEPVEICACCGNPPSYACCYSAGCNPCP